jgi:very-short-patch-repair endonuclease
LATFARAMRAEPTPFEEKLWQSLRGFRLEGLKFSRQIALNGFICDFVCRNLRLVIEVDGDTHDRAQDADRDYALGRAGYRVLRFTNADVGTNLDGVLTVILEAAKDRPSKIELLGGVTPPPNPSLGREGE